ncbi:SIMPL domain-containing protein [Reichenbachiella agarivorans]|uniref:SIMPL domain-containing protein n=1 Tax=Reichenbachiella agarivorans TaxID=2979464 RepID=A0ABY6CL70_9BACT|nr:SIMPL domain-containing protein [Reichenbachiella agarivorans]UXP31263.1 SIMPL domain-containing protein [Reichenbachiella agarivorans]
MKTYTLALALLMIGFVSLGQEQSMIHVSGQAELSVNPEIVVFNYSVHSNHKNYETAVNQLNTRVNSLLSDLKKAGFASEEIKTSHFNIRKSKIYNKGQEAGDEYIATQSLVVKFTFDKKKMLSSLNQTTEEASAPNLSISFELSDAQKKKTQESLMIAAMKDAKSKAQILANQEGYKVAGVKEIRHGVNTSLPPMGRNVEFAMMKTMADSGNVSQYEPTEITMSDEVNVSYLLTK